MAVILAHGRGVSSFRTNGEGGMTFDRTEIRNTVLKELVRRNSIFDVEIYFDLTYMT